MDSFNSFNFFRVFNNCFNKHGSNFDDVSKNGYPRPSEKKVFWNKGYDVIISVTNKILSRDSNYRCDHVTKVWEL